MLSLKTKAKNNCFAPLVRRVELWGTAVYFATFFLSMGILTCCYSKQSILEEFHFLLHFRKYMHNEEFTDTLHSHISLGYYYPRKFYYTETAYMSKLLWWHSCTVPWFQQCNGFGIYLSCVKNRHFFPLSINVNTFITHFIFTVICKIWWSWLPT